MYYGDLLALLIATFGVGLVVFYTDESKPMRIISRLLMSLIVFLWVGFGLLWLA